MSDPNPADDDPEAALFQDTAFNRSRTFPMKVSPEELAFLYKRAQQKGVHVAVVIRRQLRLLIKKNVGS